MASEAATAGRGEGHDLGGSARLSRGHPAVLLFVAAVAVSALVLIAMAPQLTFFLDDWDFLTFRYDPSWQAVMAPHNEHISIAPVLIYEALLHTFGMDSAVPFRVVATATFLAGVALLFVWIRRRVGAWLALAAVLPLLFFGAGAEDLLYPFQIGYFGSLLFGLAALLALERDDRTADVLACLALVASLTFSSVGLPFVVGAALCVAWDERRWRRAYIVVVPAVLYGLWWLGWGHEAETHLSLKNIATSPSYILDGFASSTSALFGLAAPRNDSTLTTFDWGRALLVAAAVLAVWRLLRGPRPSRWLWIVLVTALAYWFLAASSAYFEARAPTAGRYQYVGAIFVLMIAAELVRGVRVSRPAVVAVFVVSALAVAGNLSSLVDAYKGLRTTSQTILADLGAFELARPYVPPEFQITADTGGTDFVGVQALFYFPAVDAVGSPADSEAELRAAPEPAQVNADKLAAAAMGLSSDPVAKPPPVAGSPPTLVEPADATATTTGPCIAVTGGASGSAVVALPPGGVVASTPRGQGATMSLRRFSSESFPIKAGTIAPGGSTVLRIPPDAASQPWQLEIDSHGPVTVCGLAPQVG